MSSIENCRKCKKDFEQERYEIVCLACRGYVIPVSAASICAVCEQEYTKTGQNQKYCSKECKSVVFDAEYQRRVSYKSAVRSGRIANPGVGSGYGSGIGAEHHNYKTGIGIFRRHRKDACERWGSDLYLCVHHIDENRHNNEPSNLETLCKRCHQEHHAKRDAQGRYTIG